MHFRLWKRREFIAALGGAAVWPLVARAQQHATPVVGFLRSTAREDSGRLVAAFQQGLKLGGYIEGQNVKIEYRWADNQSERQPALVADLKKSQCRCYRCESRIDGCCHGSE
jgi:putative ABC transport system substrate-binding protein